MYLSGPSQVTAVRMGEGEAGRSLSELCQDTLFRMMNREACGQDIDPGTRETIPQPPAPPPPPPEPVVVTGPSAPAPEPEPTYPTNGAEPEPTETVTVTGGGWGGPAVQPSAPAELELTVTGGEERPVTERGFGLLEVIIGAGVAWVLTQAYQRRES